MQAWFDVIGHGMMITGFVFIMMVVIEYLNVLTGGRWDRAIGRWRWGQPVLTAFFGATPGCLGAFAVASLYIHRVATVGGLMAAMVATCGDEAFIMLALFPEKALLLFGILFGMGILSGIAVDLVLKGRRTRSTPHLEAYRPSHGEAEQCLPFRRTHLTQQWRNCTPRRGWLTIFFGLFLFGVVSGAFSHRHTDPGGHEPPAAERGHAEHAQDAEHDPVHENGESGWNWMRITLLALGVVGLLIVVTVPDHFLDEHLWRHLVKVHLLRIFCWTIGAVVVTELLVTRMDVGLAVDAHRLPVLVLACLVGILPASGPHVVFVTLYAEGAIPFSTLLANAIVQDGHGLIPVLAHSRRAFVVVKAGKFLLGLLTGIAGGLLGW